MNDQYGNLAPDDLTSLDINPAELTSQELGIIDALDWYQPSREFHPGFQGMVLVSWSALEDKGLGYVAGSRPENIGLRLRGVEKIEHCLHRWSVEDGFYHA